MSAPQSIFSLIQQIGDQSIGNEPFYEVRVENDQNGNPVFVGRSPFPNADPSKMVWYIIKIHYDVNGFISRVEQPTQGFSFGYSWNQRSTIFGD